MFILVTQAKHGTSARLVETFADGQAMARSFVGDHNPIDGCSSVPSLRQRLGEHGPEFSIARSTSFGPRRAFVRPISTEFHIELGI